MLPIMTQNTSLSAIPDDMGRMRATLVGSGAAMDLFRVESALGRLEAMKAGPKNVRIRPPDFQQVTNSLRKFVDKQRAEFVNSNGTVIGFADEVIDRLYACGITAFHDEKCRLELLRTDIYLLSGRAEHAYDGLIHYAYRPYLLQDQGLIGEVVSRMARNVLEQGDAEAARQWYLFGVWRFFGTTAPEWRNRFRAMVPALRTTLRQIGFAERPAVNYLSKLLLLWRSWPHEYANTLQRLTMRLVNGSLEFLAAEVLRRDSRNTRPVLAGLPASVASAGREPVLVTRAMGGIGDLLMMTPGLHALARRNGRPVHFATRRAFFPLFEGNPDVHLLDVDGEILNVLAYDHWVNLTQCPAARVESRSAPHVTENRIDIFARAMGLEGDDYTRMSRRPHYHLSDQDRAFQDKLWREHGLDGWPVIGVQLFSQDTYKDYPMMRELVHELARTYKVFVFHSTVVPGYEDNPNIIPMMGHTLREAFAAAARCSAIVSPDSAFVHFAAAFDIPTVSIFGPTSGRTFSKHYPHCSVVDMYKDMKCVPCWRNEDLSCKVTDGRKSVCLTMIPVSRLVAEVGRFVPARSVQAAL